MDSKQFNRIRSNALDEASMEHRNQTLKINKITKELDEAGDIINSLIDNYALRENGVFLPYSKQPTEIQSAIDFVTEVTSN